jgi:hypothetical protein
MRGLDTPDRTKPTSEANQISDLVDGNPVCLDLGAIRIDN